MKAIVQDRYGRPEEVLQLRKIEMPVPGDDEVRVRVKASCVHPDVWHVVTGRPYVLRLMGSGLRKPKNPVPGTDVAGIVESVGENVTQFHPGDEVFGETHAGIQWVNGGAFAEYVTVPQDVLAHKPANITFEQAATVPTSGYIALNNLRRAGRLQAGQHVLINGAGGGVGMLAVQIAKAYGAQVTGIDKGAKLDMIRALGADNVLDYTREDFSRRGERYDLILDVASNLSLADCKRALTPTGIYVVIGHDHFGKGRGRVLGSLPQMFKLLALSKFVTYLPPPDFTIPGKKETMAELKKLIEAGKLTPVIAKSFPLDEAVEAMRCLQEGAARGRIVLTV
jgi:NADPH:quinone reductase-like Zn-dependent oxidoreductase